MVRAGAAEAAVYVHNTLRRELSVVNTSGALRRVNRNKMGGLWQPFSLTLKVVAPPLASFLWFLPLTLGGFSGSLPRHERGGGHARDPAGRQLRVLCVAAAAAAAAEL